MTRNSAAKRPGADLDAWVWQSQTLADLLAFVEAHGPASSTPLPVVNWTLGTGRAISAELPSFEADAQRLATLNAYAAVLDAAVSRRTESDRTVFTVRGRIGRPEGADNQPRIRVLIQATVWRDLDQDTDGGA